MTAAIFVWVFSNSSVGTIVSSYKDTLNTSKCISQYALKLEIKKIIQIYFRQATVIQWKHNTWSDRHLWD